MRWLFALLPLATVVAQDTITIGAKNFTESAVLAELMAQVIEQHTDLAVERRTNLGGTMICWEAVRTGEVDIYAEYTGTGWAAVLQRADKVTDPLQTFLHVQQRCRDRFDVHWLQPFGLNNTYALAMPAAKAEALGIRRISDLVAHQDTLRVGFGIEFGRRNDGYLGLAATYGLSFANLRVVEHGLAYEALAAGDIDLIDAYSTDGKLRRYDLQVLEDDRSFFPPYNAAPVVNGETLRKHPEIRAALRRIAFAVSDTEAQQLNYEVEANGREPADVVREFLTKKELSDEPRSGFVGEGYASQLGGWLLQHLWLTGIAVLLAAIVAIPLGVAVSRRPRLQQIVLAVAGVVQTVPSLALLAFMIPLLGLNAQAAIAALFLYALLPILRNTCTGISGVDRDLIDAARGMGMRDGEVLRHVELPLATPTIMAGVRTATVISVGVATLAAFIGAGGLGEPIVEGLNLNDPTLILKGAVPAAVLAVLADLALARVERRLTPRPA